MIQKPYLVVGVVLLVLVSVLVFRSLDNSQGGDPVCSLDSTQSVQVRDSVLSNENPQLIFASTQDEVTTLNVIDLEEGTIEPFFADIDYGLSSKGRADWSPDGQWFAFTWAPKTKRGRSNDTADEDLYVLDVAAGTVIRLTANSWQDTNPSWSPDGTQISYTSRTENGYELFIIDVACLPDCFPCPEPQQITYNRVYDIMPDWSPDGSRLIYISMPRSTAYTVELDRNTLPRSFRGEDLESARFPTWSPDGTQIAISAWSTETYSIAIFVADTDGGNIAHLFDSEGEESGPAWSPDSSQIAFASDQDGDFEIYVVDRYGGNVRQLTDNEYDDVYPIWRPPVVDVEPTGGD